MRTINAVKIEGTLKRSAVVVALAAMLFALLGVLAPAASNASSSSAVVCKLKANKKVVCPTAQLRGPRGPAGPAGPQGPAGPAGSGGSGAVDVRAFNFLATGNTPNTTITTLTGAVAEAGCTGGDFTGDRVRATADNGSIDVINFDDTFNLNVFDFDIGDTIALHFEPNADEDAQYGLTYMSAGGAENASAHYYADDSSLVGGTFDCSIYGTIQVA